MKRLFCFIVILFLLFCRRGVFVKRIVSPDSITYKISTSNTAIDISVKYISLYAHNLYSKKENEKAGFYPGIVVDIFTIATNGGFVSRDYAISNVFIIDSIGNKYYPLPFYRVKRLFPSALYVFPRKLNDVRYIIFDPIDHNAPYFKLYIKYTNKTISFRFKQALKRVDRH